jgi:hypothetical protein
MYSSTRAVLVGGPARLTVPQKIVSRGGNVSEDVAAFFLLLASIHDMLGLTHRSKDINFWSGR